MFAAAAILISCQAQAQESPGKRHVVISIDGSGNKKNLQGFGNLAGMPGQLSEVVFELQESGSGVTFQVPAGNGSDYVLEKAFPNLAESDSELSEALETASSMWEEGGMQDDSYGNQLLQALDAANAYKGSADLAVVLITASSDYDPVFSAAHESEIIERGIPIVVSAFCESPNGLTVGNSVIKGVAVTPEDAEYLTRVARATGGAFYSVEDCLNVSYEISEGLQISFSRASFSVDAEPSASPIASASPLPQQEDPHEKVEPLFDINSANQVIYALMAAVAALMLAITAVFLINRKKSKPASGVAAPSTKMKLQVMPNFSKIPESLFYVDIPENFQTIGIKQILAVNRKEWARHIEFDDIKMRRGKDGVLEIRELSGSGSWLWREWLPMTAVQRSVNAQGESGVIQFIFVKGDA
jgi:hypothetical protein